MATSAVRRTVRVILLTVCTLAIVALVGGVVRQSWVVNGSTAAVVRLEEQGAAMLHPVTTLLAELVQNQSAAVRGERVNPETLRQALAAVDEVDREHGEALGTRQRLASLTSSVETAVARNETGRAAFETYSALVTLTIDLIRTIGDTSHLIHDPDLDSYYLMDAAIVRLPEATVLAGRAADLVVLAGGGVLEGEDEIRAHVARFGVSAAAEAVQAGLNTSVEVTARSDLSVNITERLDAFKAAADAFAPPTMIRELSGAVDAAELAANALRVATTANPLAHRLLGELQALLSERAATLERERRFTVVAASAAGVVGLIIVWMLVLGRTRPRTIRVQPSRSGAAEDLPLGSLTYARDLLESEELIHAGRTDRAPERRRDAR